MGKDFLSFYEDGSGRFVKRIGQNWEIFLSVFQNGSFYAAKWPVLPRRMIHFVE